MLTMHPHCKRGVARRLSNTRGNIHGTKHGNKHGNKHSNIRGNIHSKIRGNIQPANAGKEASASMTFRRMGESARTPTLPARTRYLVTNQRNRVVNIIKGGGWRHVQ